MNVNNTNSKSMKVFKSYVFVSILMIASLMLTSCAGNKTAQEAGADDPDLLHKSVKKITDVMVHDIFSPPVASRVYAYTSIAAYEAVAVNSSEYRSLAGQVKGLTRAPENNNDLVSTEFAGLHALLEVGKELTFSTEKVIEFQDSLYRDLKDRGLSPEIFDASLAYGDQVALHILDWASKDNYKETRGGQKYTVTDDPSRWIPTPPSYMDAIEPNWNRIRTMVMDSAQQFKPVPPVPYSMEKGSEFYNQVMEVYEIGQNLTEEEKEIAKFWDCNPFATQVRGHFMFAVKKLTPGGHWMGIAGIASKKTGADFKKSAEVYALTSIALFDAFISSWDEKFRSNLVRPETVINREIDPDWKPLLQTPPFPEYTSGHSVISRAAAEMLTDIFGEPFYFEDTTELEYGLPVRTFNSFIEASDEAAVSRLYGGIHYRMAADHGITQGEEVGELAVQRLTTSGQPLAEASPKK